MKEVYIITAFGSDGEFFTRKIFGTREEAQNYMLEIIEEDRNEDTDNFSFGTKDVYDLEVIDSNGFCGFNMFNDYSIEYYAVPYNDIKQIEN